MKVGEIFTADRYVNAGTGYCYAPVLISGGVALISCESTPVIKDLSGGVMLHRFVFQFVSEGNAKIQFAYYRPFDLNEILYEDVLPFVVEASENDVTFGGWSKFVVPTEYDKSVLNTALGQIIGVRYIANNVSKQVVNGTNYRFACTATSATHPPKSYPVIIEVYVPLSGLNDAKLISITKVCL